MTEFEYLAIVRQVEHKHDRNWLILFCLMWVFVSLVVGG